MDYKLDKLLKRVEKPGRYIGGEINSVIKNPKDMDVNFCFAFPDLYEIGHIWECRYFTMCLIKKTIYTARGFLLPHRIWKT